MTATIHPAYLRLILKSADTLKLPGDVIRTRMGLDEAAIAGEARVPVEATFRLWAALVDLSGDMAVGLRLAGHARAASAGALEYAARNCPTVGDLLQMVAQYARLLNTAAEIAVDTQPSGVELSYRLLERHPVHPASTDFAVGYLMYRVRELSGRLLMPAEIGLPQALPADTRVYRALLGKNLRWGQPGVRVRFTLAQWQTSVQTPDPELARLMRQMVEREMGNLPPDDDICAQIKAEILRAGGGPALSLDAVAGRLGLTARTAQRRLKLAGTTFRALSKRVRMDRAADLIRAGHLPLAEVGFEVGFSELSTFCRAFRKTYGVTPTQFRQAQMTGADAP